MIQWLTRGAAITWPFDAYNTAERKPPVSAVSGLWLRGLVLLQRVRRAIGRGAAAGFFQPRRTAETRVGIGRTALAAGQSRDHSKQYKSNPMHSYPRL